MTESKAQRQASLRYRKSKTKTISVVFYPADMYLLNFLNGSDEPKQTHIKRLIEEEYRRAKNE